MSFQLDLNNEKLPKLDLENNKRHKINMIEIVDDDFSFDLNLSARLNGKDEEGSSSLRNGSRNQYSRVINSPCSSLNSAGSFMNSNFDIKDQIDRVETDVRPKSVMDDIIKTLEGDSIECSSEKPCDDVELNKLYKSKYISVKEESDKLHLQVKYHQNIAEVAESELAALKVKSESMKESILDLKSKLKEANNEKMDSQCDVERHQQNVARLNALVLSLQRRVQEAEDRADAKQSNANKSDSELASLAKELRSCTDDRRQLETSLKSHIQNSEELIKKVDLWKGRYNTMTTELGSLLDIDTTTENIDASLLSKTAEIVRESTIMKKKIEKAVDNVQSTQLEAKASRETISRLVNDANKEQKTLSNMRVEIDDLKREKESSRYALLEKETELKNLREQLDQSQEVWSKTRKMLEEKILEIDKLTTDLKSNEKQSRAAHNRLLQFRSTLANILTDEYNTVKEEEEMIVHHVKDMQTAVKKLTIVEQKLASKLKLSKEEMRDRERLQKTTLQRVIQSEEDYKSVEERLQSLEGDMVAADIDRQDLLEERKKYMSFLDSLTRVMKLDVIAMDAGFDLTAEAIISRCQQLVKKDTDTIQDRTQTIYSLQRKVKQLNQKLESKELHLNISRTKSSELEELLKEKTRADTANTDASAQLRKANKKLEKVQGELSEQKYLVTKLKAELNDVNGLRVVNDEQKKIIEDLELSVNRLAKSKYKTAKQLKGAQEKIDSNSKLNVEAVEEIKAQLTEARVETQEACNKIKDLEQREKQLLEFRDLLAHLIGLKVENLSVPDFEIIQRVENLVKTHTSYINTSKNLERTLAEMDKSFKPDLIVDLDLQNVKNSK